MKKIRNYIILGSLILILTGCGSTKNELTTENLKKTRINWKFNNISSLLSQCYRV